MAPKRKPKSKSSITKSVNNSKRQFVHSGNKERWEDVVDLNELKIKPEKANIFKILAKIRKNTALLKIVQLVDVASHKNTDLDSLRKKLLEMNILKFTMAAEYAVTYKETHPPWTVKDYMSIVESYANLKNWDLAHEMVAITVHEFGRHKVKAADIDLTDLYLKKIENDKYANKHIPVAITPRELEKLVPLNAVGRKRKLKLMEEPKCRFLAKYFTDVSLLRGVEAVKDQLDHKFFKNYVRPSSYLSLKGLLKAAGAFPKNKMLNKHQVGQFMLLYGHDGHDSISNKAWNHKIWKTVSPFAFAAQVESTHDLPFPTYDLQTKHIYPIGTIAKTLEEISATKPLTTMAINGLKALEKRK